MWENNITRDLKELFGPGQGSHMDSCKSKNEPACSILGTGITEQTTFSFSKKTVSESASQS
jgi:hypothetical protein